MKTHVQKLLGAAAFCYLLAAPLQAEDTSAPIDFGKFTPAKGGEFVEINIDRHIIALAMNLVKNSEPAVADALKGLKAIKVNVLGLTDENREQTKKKISDIRTSLDTGGWKRIVTVLKENEDVGIYLKTRHEESVEGIVVTVLEGDRQAVLINITGDIRPEKLAMIGDRFGIDPLKGLAPIKADK